MSGDYQSDHSSLSAHTRLPRSDHPPSMFGPLDDRGIPLRLHFRIIWNRRWLILAIVLATSTVVVIRTLRQKPVYKAVGTLEIEMPTKSIASIQDFFPSANVPDGYLQTQSKILSSGQLTSQVMDKLNLSVKPELSRPSSRWSQELSFQKRLNVQVVKGSQLVQVAFESEDPSLAAKVVNQLMALYINQVQEDRFETASGASSWVLGQLKETKAKLDESMDTLRRYEREHQLLSVNPDRERLMNIDGERLEQLQKELATVEGTRIEKEAIHRRLQAGDTQMLQSSFLEENLKKEAELEAQLAQISNKFGPQFPQVKRTEAELTEVRKILAAERDRLSREIEAVYQSAVEQEALTRSEIEEQRKKVSGGSDQLMQDNILKRDVDLNQQAYEGLLQKLQEATNTASLKAVNARIVDPAEPPAVSSYPGLGRNLALSLMIGLTMGIGIALSEEHLRDTIKAPGEVDLDLNVPLLGVVPAVGKLKILGSPDAKRNGFRVRGQGRRSNDKPDSGQWFRLDRDGPNHYELSEAIRNLRTSLLFALEGKGPQSVLFSSSVPSEGKTTISSNISISLTQLGKKMLMIDGDLRRPCLHRVFSISNRPGLSEYLQEVCEWEDVVQSTDIPGLDIVVCGERPLNPAELLSSDRMRRIIEQAKRRYDLVVVDSPTLLNMADSRILASYVDSVVLIVRSRATPKILAKQACANVRGAGATIVGAVLNQLEIGDSEYSYSYYGYPKNTSSLNGEQELRSERV
jgi:succinoglycan biosynthesis transport protein ExoP